MFEIDRDVYGIDLEMFDADVLAAYVIDAAEPILIEAGYARSVDIIRDGLREAGIAPTDLSHVVVSHVHLDHSGGVAGLAADAPDLDVYIHESTAHHLVDPERLVESSRQAMGDHFGEFGAPDPIAEDVLVPVGDGGHVLDAGDRTLELVHTPGHAPDHVAAWDEESGTLFANEAIGSYYPRADTWLPPATLPRFDAAAVGESIETLREFPADRIALSHFGVRDDPAATFEVAADRLAYFEERIPELYDEHGGDLEATEDAVGDQLVGLEEYDDALVEFETGFQTRGFLKYLDRL